MSSVSTFGAFSMAKLGIWASQKAMQVTGNNITNINTPGYTRQELKLDSLYVGGADRYASKWDSKTGSGVIVSGVRQIRSPYLDIRYRTENSTTGYYEDKLNGLYGLSSFLDEVGKGEDDEGVMEAAFQNMIEQLTHYNTSGAGENTFDTVFRGSVSQVLSIFNTYANKLENLYETTKESFREDVETVNGILSDIRHLNVQIRKADIHGSNALELRDSRNMLIDELSRYMKIDVIYDEEDIGAGVMVEKLTIRLDSADDSSQNHHGTPLVDGKYATQLKVPDVNVPEQHPAPEFQGNFDVTLDRLRDEKGVPKWLIEPEAAVFASDPDLWTQTDKDGNVTYVPRPAGDVTIGGYTAKISAPDTTKSLEEQVADQLREFCGQYNRDPNNTQFRASMALDKTCVIFTAINAKLTPAVPAEVDTTDPAQVTVTTDANGDTFMEIAGYKAKVRATSAGSTAPTSDQLQDFMDAYNSDTENSPNRAYLNGTTMKFDGKPLEKGGDLTIMVPTTLIGTGEGDPTTKPYAVFIKNAESMTREEQLEAFCDIFNKDPDNNPPMSATLSEDGNQIIFKEDGDGAMTRADAPGTLGTSVTPTATGNNIKIPGDNFTATVPGADTMSDKQLAKAFCDAYNADQNNIDNNKAAVVSEDGTQIVIKDLDSRMVKSGVTGVLDPNNTEVALTDTDLYGALQAKRELLTEEGEFASKEDLIRDPKAAEKRGIPYYQRIWDAMARKFADTLNDANTLEDETTGDLKRGENGNYIVDPKNYYLTDENGNYIDSDGNIIEGDPDNPYSYKEYYTTTVKAPNGADAEVYADKDGNPLLSDPANSTSYIYKDTATVNINGKDTAVYADKKGNPLLSDPANTNSYIQVPEDGYLVYSKNDKGEYLDAAGNVLKPNADGTYTAYLQDADGRYLNEKGQVIAPNPDGTYCQYKQNASNQFVDANNNPITPNPDGSYWVYRQEADPNNTGKLIFVDENGKEIKPNADGTYWQYKTAEVENPDGTKQTVYVGADGETKIEANPDGTYWQYKTAEVPANPNDPDSTLTKTVYVGADGKEIEPNADGTYWKYKTNAAGDYVGTDGTTVIQPNVDKDAQGKPDYAIYATVKAPDANGVEKEYYVDTEGNQTQVEVGSGQVPPNAKVIGDRREPDYDRRVPDEVNGVKVDRRVPDEVDGVKVDRRVPETVTGADGVTRPHDRRVPTDVDRRVVVDPRAFTDVRIAAIKDDKRVVREQYRGGVLISNSGNSNDREGITAKNISVSRNWGNDTIHVMQSRDNTELEQSTANSNIRHMISIMKDNKYQFVYSDFDDAFEDGDKDASYFTGSFADLMTKICSTLADDTKKSEDRLLNSNDALTEIATDRDSVSGVDLNDEAINMMQYNKSYSAACRFMTTLDEMIDKLINGTAI